MKSTTEILAEIKDHTARAIARTQEAIEDDQEQLAMSDEELTSYLNDWLGILGPVGSLDEYRATLRHRIASNQYWISQRS